MRVEADTQEPDRAARRPATALRALGPAHLDAAYSLARWLCGGTADAEDVVQEAYLRAYRFFHTFRGDNIRVWLPTIVAILPIPG